MPTGQDNTDDDKGWKPKYGESRQQRYREDADYRRAVQRKARKQYQQKQAAADKVRQHQADLRCRLVRLPDLAIEREVMYLGDPVPGKAVKVYTPSELAAALGIGYTTISRWMKRRVIPYPVLQAVVNGQVTNVFDVGEATHIMQMMIGKSGKGTVRISKSDRPAITKLHVDVGAYRAKQYNITNAPQGASKGQGK